MNLLSILLQFGPPAPPDRPDCWPPPCVSVDQYIGVLLIAGILLAIYCIKKHDKKFKN